MKQTVCHYGKRFALRGVGTKGKGKNRVIEVDKQTVAKNLSTALYQIRWGKNLSQPTIAEATKITQQQLSAYEKGTMLPSLQSLILLAEVYDVSLDYLVGRCDNSQAHKTRKGITKYKE